MKILHAGTNGFRPWWVGRIVRCGGGCGQIVELEPKDQGQLIWGRGSDGIDRVILACEVCRWISTILPGYRAPSTNEELQERWDRQYRETPS